MNDYTIGALEALAFSMAVINKHIDKDEKGPVLDVYSEIEATELKLLAGTAIVFRDKVDLIKTMLPGETE